MSNPVAETKQQAFDPESYFGSKLEPNIIKHYVEHPESALSEDVVQKRLEKETGGKHARCLMRPPKPHDSGYGVADIVTETELIEIKRWGDVRGAVPQILGYAPHFPGRKLRIHLFGCRYRLTATTDRYMTEMKQHNIAVSEEVWLDGKWQTEWLHQALPARFVAGVTAVLTGPSKAEQVTKGHDLSKYPPLPFIAGWQ